MLTREQIEAIRAKFNFAFNAPAYHQIDELCDLALRALQEPRPDGWVSAGWRYRDKTTFSAIRDALQASRRVPWTYP